MKKEKFRPAVFILPYCIEKSQIYYLLLKRKLHWIGWEFPKGKIEKGETKRQTVERELKEEAGLIPIRIIKFNEKGKYNYNKKFPDRPGYTGQSYQLFAVEVKESKIKLDKLEHSNYKWISFNRAYEKLTWPNQKKCLKIVDNYLKDNF